MPDWQASMLHSVSQQLAALDKTQLQLHRRREDATQVRGR
jgi:hypothetical protein